MDTGSEEPSRVAQEECIDEARVRKLKLVESPTCVICVESVKSKSFPCSCLHIFCFHCLVKWSKQKAQCPLCKKGFDAIIHNVKSKTEYDIYQVVVNRPEPSDSPINLTDLSIPVIPIELNSVYHRVNFLTNYGQPRRRFTYRTRFGLLLSVEFSHNFDDNVSPNIEADPMQITRIQELFGTENYTRLTPAEWRRNVYDRRLYALPLPDDLGRFRECSPEFYRENPAQTHRLIPWLNRELVVLMPQNNTSLIPQILEDLRGEMLGLYDIRSREIRDYFRRFLHERTDHFVHEFYSFACSPYDIVGYDRHVDYEARLSEDAAVEISSNESSDSEVQVIEADDIETTSENQTPGDPINNALVVESDSDNSEVLFVLALKPPEQRTPEQVFLDSASDSDVQFIPNSPARNNSPPRSPINRSSPENQIKLKAETDVKHGTSESDEMQSDKIIPEQNFLNVGASTSTLADENLVMHKENFYHPARERVKRMKRIFEDSTTSNSSSSDEWQLQSSPKRGKKYSKSTKTRRKNSKSVVAKKKLLKSSTQKLALLTSSEKTTRDDAEES